MASQKLPLKHDRAQLYDLYDPRLLLSALRLCGDPRRACLQRTLHGLPQAVPRKAHELWQAVMRQAEPAAADVSFAVEITLQLESCLDSGPELCSRPAAQVGNVSITIFWPFYRTAWVKIMIVAPCCVCTSFLVCTARMYHA